jgi:lactate dehydrogenase-like 2-hydroxyacid dehydrogenase
MDGICHVRRPGERRRPAQRRLKKQGGAIVASASKPAHHSPVGQRAGGAYQVADFDVLVPLEGIAPISSAVDQRLKLHRLWREPDREAALERLAPRIKAIASTSHLVKVDAALMSRFPQLQIVASFGVGYDHIDAAWAGRHGIIVTHTPGVLDDEVADLAMALTIAIVRKLPQAERYLREGRWRAAPYPLTASLRGRTMGILGLGRIGKAIAQRAVAFGLGVVYHGRAPQAGAPYLYHPTLEGMARACDILMVCAPGGAQTRHIVDGAVLDALGPDGVLVNVARGSLVDEAALIAALQEARILGAGLDVFQNEPNVPAELLALDNVVLTPHVGSASHHTRQAMADLMIANLESWRDGKGPLTPVPETPWRAG